MLRRIHGGVSWIDSEKFLDFSVNVNPFGPPKEIVEKLYYCINNKAYKFYSDPNYRLLHKTLSEAYDIDEKNLVHTAGASEALFLIIKCLISRGFRNVFLLSPTYGEPEIKALAKELGARASFILMGEAQDKFYIDLDSLIDNMKDIKNTFLIISNPNNPTGIYIDQDNIKAIAESLEGRGFLIIDEAYSELSRKRGGLDLLNYYDNLIVVRTLTKLFATPGLRTGFLASRNKRLIECLEALRPTWNIDSISSCVFSGRPLRDKEWFKKFISDTSGKIKALREDLENGLKKIGFKVFRSEANFILSKIIINYNPEEFYRKLYLKNIVVRNCDSFKGLDPRYFRVGVKDCSSNKVLLETIKEVIKE